jgi:alpha-L-fucosidase
MPCLEGKVKYAQFLHDGSEVKYDPQAGFACNKMEKVFLLPTVKPDAIVPVIEVFLK